MSQRTVRYILLPRLKSFWTSCRTAKARCEGLFVRNKPRRAGEYSKVERGPGLAPQKVTRERPVGAEPLAPEGK